MKVKVLKPFKEGQESFSKDEIIPVRTGAKEPKGKHLNLRRYNSLKGRGYIKDHKEKESP